MCEIRFTVSSKDGKLEKMLAKVNAGARTEFVKEALKYYLIQIRDEEVESMYLDASDLAEFKSDIKSKSSTLDDVINLLKLNLNSCTEKASSISKEYDLKKNKKDFYIDINEINDNDLPNINL